MANLQEIKNEYVRISLERYGNKVVDKMKIEMKRLKIGVEDDLLSSLSFKVSANGNNSHGLLNLVMKDYGPFQDMGVGRGAGLAITNGKRLSSLTKRRPKKFYSPIAYGYLNSLIGMIQFGLTQDVVASIKSELENKI